jgi:hypothetical protein
MEVLALRHQLKRFQALRQAAEADRFGTGSSGMFGSNVAELP